MIMRQNATHHKTKIINAIINNEIVIFAEPNFSYSILTPVSLRCVRRGLTSYSRFKRIFYHLLKSHYCLTKSCALSYTLSINLL